MRVFSLLFIGFILLSCGSKTNERDVSQSYRYLLDSLRTESKAVDILFYREFSTSKISILAAGYRTIQGIDTALSYFGYESIDTSCGVFSEGTPIGQVIFYRDTSRTESIVGFDFTLNGDCKGFYDGLDRSSKKVSMSLHGQKQLEVLYRKVKSYWEE